MRQPSFNAKVLAPLAGGLLCLAVGSVASSAAAAPQAPATAAASGPSGAVDPAEAFDVGRRLWEGGDFATALPLFERALESSGSPNARLYVARCLRDLGRLPEAHREMNRTVTDAMALAEKEPRYAATRDTAAAELALLDRKVAKVVVALGEAWVGSAVTINGVAAGASLLGQPMAVSPGPLQIVALRSDGQQVRRDVEAVPGAVLTVTLTTDAPSPPPPQPLPPPPEPSEGEDEAGFGVVQGVGIGVALLGIAGFVTFGVERAAADGEIATLEQDCGPGPCSDPTYADVVDRGKTAETISAVGLVVGLAGVLAGTAMIVFGAPDAADAEAAWAPTGDGFRVRF